MKNRLSSRSLVLAWAALILLPCPSFSGVNHRYVEDFSTTTYRDGVATTAFWDTETGELKLPPFATSIIGGYDTPDFSYDVAIAGNIAYVADGSSGLQIINISDPAHPAFIASLDTPGTASGIAVAGNYAYIADGATVRVIDIHNPASPTNAANVSITGGAARNITLSGDYAYVAAATAGMVVLNIAHPTAPAIAGTYDTPGSASDIAVDGDYAYIADSNSGVTLVNIADPTHPAGIWSMDTPGSARGVAVAGTYAYVADYNGGLQVLDISDRRDPQIAAALSLHGYAYGAAVDGDRLYIPAGTDGVHVIDVRDPRTPVLRETCDTPGDARAVSLAGHLAFVADREYGLQVLELSQAIPLEPAAVFPMTYAPEGIKIAGDYLYATNAYEGLLVVDVSDPANPVAIGSCDSGYADGVDVAGDHAYIADQDYGMRVIDISDPRNPVLVATVDTPGCVYDITVDGNYAYLSDQVQGVQVVNISDPLHPVIVGHFATAGWAWTIAVDGDFAFVGEAGTGIRVLDITNPASPISIGVCATPGTVTGIALAGDLAYLAGPTPGMIVMNITNPASPSIVGTCDLSGTARNLCVQGNRAYLAGNMGFSVVDVTNPTLPVLLDGYQPPNTSYVYEIAVAGDYAYLGNSSASARSMQPVKFSSADCQYEGRNTAQSLRLSPPGLGLVKAKFSSMQTGAIDWSIQADGAAQWQAIVPDDTWQTIASPGSDLIWKGVLGMIDHCTSTVCTQLELDWLYEPAVIDSVRDIGNDQGGRVRIRFARSSHDFANEAAPIVGYNVWRRVDDGGLVRQIEAAESGGGAERSDRVPAGLGGLPLISVGQRWFLPRGTGGETGTRGFPPGTWEVLGGFWATQQDEYVYEASTVTDSAATVFCVSAHTDVPSVWFVSPPDSGRSIDNIAPHVPTGFRVVHAVGHNSLEWDACPDEDFEYFRVYRGTSPDFVPAPENLAQKTIDTSWQDAIENGWQYYYKLTAVDHAGNESAAASGQVMGVEDPTPARTLLLHRSTPNPFRPPTTIVFETPAAGSAKVAIYDARGRLVRVLLDRAVAAGRTTVPWDGHDAIGRDVPSGAYFIRLDAEGKTRTEGMTLVR